MDVFALTVASPLLAAIAAYAHIQLSRYIARPTGVLMTRAVLIGVGVAAGAVAATSYPDRPPLSALAFIAGFGIVHFPAAFILFVKHARGAGRT